MADEIARVKVVVEAETDSVESSIDKSVEGAKKLANEAETAVERVSRATKKAAKEMASAVDFVADEWEDASDKVDKYVAAAVRAEAAAKDVGEGASEKLKEAGRATEKTTKNFKDLVGVVTSSVGIFTGLAGAITVVIGAITLLGRRTLDAAKKTGEANQKFTDLHRAILALDPGNSGPFIQISQQIDALNDAIVEANTNTEQENYLLELSAGLREKLTKQELDRRYKEERDAARAAATELDAYATAIRRAVDAQNDPIAAAEQEYDDTVRKLNELNNARGFGSAEQASIRTNFSIALKNAETLRDTRIAHIKEEAQARADAEKKAIEDAERQHQERLLRIQKEADAFARALENALSGLADSLFGTGGDNITTKLDTLVNELRQIKDDMGALR